MTAYPRITRFLATTAAGAAILVSTAGCHLLGSDLEAAGRAAVHNPVGRHLPEKAVETIRDIPGTLNDLREFADGTVQSAVIGTACDAYAQGNDHPDYVSGTLSNLLGDTQPPEKQLLDAVQNLVTTFTYDEQNGLTTTREIAAACQAYQLKGNFS